MFTTVLSCVFFIFNLFIIDGEPAVTLESCLGCCESMFNAYGSSEVIEGLEIDLVVIRRVCFIGCNKVSFTDNQICNADQTGSCKFGEDFINKGFTDHLLTGQLKREFCVAGTLQISFSPSFSPTKFPTNAPQVPTVSTLPPPSSISPNSFNTAKVAIMASSVTIVVLLLIVLRLYLPRKKTSFDGGNVEIANEKSKVSKRTKGSKTSKGDDDIYGIEVSPEDREETEYDKPNSMPKSSNSNPMFLGLQNPRKTAGFPPPRNIQEAEEKSELGAETMLSLQRKFNFDDGETTFKSVTSGRVGQSSFVTSGFLPSRTDLVNSQFIVTHAFVAEHADELTVSVGDMVLGLKPVSPDWWLVRNASNQVGLVPTTFMEEVYPEDAAASQVPSYF